MKEHKFYVRGMHCASCELLIEKKLLELKTIKSADASLAQEIVKINYNGERPSTKLLNRLFRKFNYTFYNQPFSKEETEIHSNNHTFQAIIVAFLFIVVFIFLGRYGLAGFGNITNQSSLGLILVFGVLAGVSSCAALVGGIVLSMSKNWQQAYASSQSLVVKLTPHIMFNAGRAFVYTAIGALLGALGSQLQLSIKFMSILVVLVSIVMAMVGLNMLGVKFAKKWQLSAPKSLTRLVVNQGNFHAKWMPFILGALTFILPCGFTITAEGLALLSGSALSGVLVMLAFTLGTAIPLLGIGLSSIKLLDKPQKAELYLKTAGALVIFFAIFNLNNQLNVWGFKSLNDINFSKLQASFKQAQENQIIISQKDNQQTQVIKTKASARGYTPRDFKVKAGIPVRWEVTDAGTSGCTNAIISPSLFEGPILLGPGKVAVKEFTPKTPGNYKYSCWMGMISGNIEVY